MCVRALFLFFPCLFEFKFYFCYGVIIYFRLIISIYTNFKSNFMCKKLIVLFLLILGTSTLFAQSKEITGLVTSKDDGAPLPGVSVIVQGTTKGTETDFDGKYSIQVSTGDVLSFSFIGMKTTSITVEESNTYDIALSEDSASLEEVVVTALGIKRQKRSLTYATQKVSTEEISKARPLNVVNSLSGKVAGISVTRSGSGVAGASKVILRGSRSISGSSQPIYVVDGVVVSNGIENISPDDIESIDVLRGPNAAALYGSRANNGAIVLTTKSGQSIGKKFSINISSTITGENVNILTDYQNEFGQGVDGVYSANTTNSWGPRMDGQSVAHWSSDPNFGSAQYNFSPQPNNVKDFFQTGFNIASNLSISTNNEKTSTYFSYTNTKAVGVVTNNELKGHNFSVRVSSKITDKLKVDGKLNYIQQRINNELDQGESFSNPIRHALRLPRNIRTEDAKIFEFSDPSGNTLQHYWKPNDNGGANPYWTINRNLSELLKDRVLASASLSYELTPELTAQVRASMDKLVASKETSWYNDSYIIADNGDYFTRNGQGQEFNGDVLLSYKKEINKDWKFNVNAGANYNQIDIKTVNTRNNGLNVANLFAVNNAVGISVTQTVFPKKVNSIYGFGQISYKNALFLDITGRNDWSSTLPSANRSYFYPSIGLTAVLSDLIKLPETISYAKLRTSWATVGSDTDPFKLDRAANLGLGGANGVIEISPIKPVEDLKPEKTISTEIGLDLRFLENRIGLDFTYYKSNTTDQLFATPVPSSSGASSVFQNGADVQNTGVEIILNLVPVKTDDFTWNFDLNFAKNNSEVLKVAEGFNSIELPGRDFLRRYRIEAGSEFGNVYSRGYQRDDQGRVIVGTNGIPLVTPGFSVNIANFNPDWTGGIRNTMSYKNFNLSFLIDIRQGGSVASFSNAVLAADGATSETLTGRDGTAVFGQNVFGNITAVKEDGTPNDIPVDSQALWQALGGRNAPVGEAFVRDASNIRLRELVLGYNVSQSILEKSPFESASISIVGRNLFFFSNKAEDIDPEVTTGIETTSGNEADGFESFSPPPTSTFGVNIKFGF